MSPFPPTLTVGAVQFTMKLQETLSLLNLKTLGFVDTLISESVSMTEFEEAPPS